MRIIKYLISRIRGEQSLNKLIKRGLKVGENPCIMSGVHIDPSHCWHIEIGDDVQIGHGTQIIAHDASTLHYLKYTRIGNIKIGNRVFIGAGSIILPGVTIGDNVIIGAGSVVTRSIEENSVAVGSPAKVVFSIEEYIERKRSKMNSHNQFNEEYTLRSASFSSHHKLDMIAACDQYGEAFVE